MNPNRQQQQTLTGEVVTVRLLKNDWGRLTLRGGSGDTATHTVMGPVLGIDVGTTVECRGVLDVHPQYGEQFRAKTIVTIVPSSAAGAIAWLASKLPRIGRKRATMLVEHYGIPALWTVLDEDPMRLVEVPGITEDAARAIGAEYGRVKGDREEMVMLRGWGLTEGQIARCREAWGKDIIARLRANPYDLYDVKGFGFVTADSVAKRMGVPETHPGRARAGALYCIGVSEQEGNAYTPRGGLIAFACDELQVARALVSSALDALVAEGRLIEEDGRIYSAAQHRAEVSIYERIAAMAGAARVARAA